MSVSRRIPVACGIDIGTSNSKVVAIDSDGSVVARVIRTTPRHPIDLTIDASVLMAAIEQMVADGPGPVI